jgi:hypothetical protein
MNSYIFDSCGHTKYQFFLRFLNDPFVNLHRPFKINRMFWIYIQILTDLASAILGYISEYMNQNAIYCFVPIYFLMILLLLILRPYDKILNTIVDVIDFFPFYFKSLNHLAHEQ